jgi:hypothetical protein
LRKKLKLLDELQELDLRIDGLVAEKEQLLARGEELRRKVEEARGALEAKRGDLATLEEEKQQREGSIAIEGENIVRSEGRLREIKTQKEYQAVQREITAAKKQQGELEEQVLQLLARIDEIQGGVTGDAEKLAALEAEVGTADAELTEALVRIDQQLGSEDACRQTLVVEIPASLIRRYSLLREQRRGIAVVEARDGSCMGCNMQIPPQMYNLLFRGDDLHTCPHCQRVLILRQGDQG